MLFTLSICTRNRASSLARTLASIEQATPVSCQWELLIVDNASNDATTDVIGSFENRLPIRRLYEAEPGLSNARNAAVASARGQYMVCTDDDVVVFGDWLTSYVNAFHKWPATSLFGGHIIPLLEEPATEWFTRVVPQLGGMLAIRNLGDSPMVLPVDNEYLPFGANFAVQTEIQRRFPFPANRGPGKVYLGDETPSFMAMLEAGHEGRWLPESRVHHLIGSSRQNEAYIRWWFESLGRTVVWEGRERHMGPQLFAAPRWLWRRALSGELKYRRLRLTSPPEIWVKQLIEVSLDWGRLRQFRSIRD
jgi:hypothetical protein